MKARKPRRSLAAVLTYAPTLLEVVAQECVDLVTAFFQGDGAKALAWFSERNHMLGEQIPREMLADGRGERLLAFIRAQIAENPPAIPDPTCPKACGRCWSCLRKKHGPDYWTKGLTE